VNIPGICEKEEELGDRRRFRSSFGGGGRITMSEKPWWQEAVRQRMEETGVVLGKHLTLWRTVFRGGEGKKPTEGDSNTVPK